VYVQFHSSNAFFFQNSQNHERKAALHKILEQRERETEHFLRLPCQPSCYKVGSKGGAWLSYIDEPMQAAERERETQQGERERREREREIQRCRRQHPATCRWQRSVQNSRCMLVDMRPSFTQAS
jgi:hypothetical protein